jgi:hypothetical protein
MKDFVDDLYQQAAENPDIPFNEQAWEQMEQKLIHAERKRRRGLFWLFFWVFLSLGLGLLWGIQHFRSLPVQQRLQQEEPIARQKPQHIQPTEQKSAPTDSSTNPGIRTDPGAVSSRSSSTSGQTVEPSAARPKALTSRQRLNHKATAKQAADPTETTLVLNVDPTAPASARNPDSIAQAATAANTSVLSVFAPLSKDWPTLIASIPTASWEPLLPLPAPVMPKPKASLSSWGIGLSAGPDLASVNANGSTAYGLNAGMALDYRLGKRWVFQGSAQYLLKNYIADQREYVAPPGFWPGKMYPQSTEGTCDMLQWSVDVRYNWLAQAKWKAFLGAGSSSWTILREQYEFYYTKYYPGQVHNWSSGQNKNYWFALGQFNLGVERSLRPGLGLQVNWFAQMPFQGVGNGKVEIYSSGVGFMLHQQLGRGHK